LLFRIKSLACFQVQNARKQWQRLACLKHLLRDLIIDSIRFCIMSLIFSKYGLLQRTQFLTY
jgi:hypothetical protein